MSETLRTFYVQRPNGRPLGTVEADDANQAQLMATTMWGSNAYVFPRSHTSWAERLLGTWVQHIADKAE